MLQPDHGADPRHASRPPSHVPRDEDEEEFHDHPNPEHMLRDHGELADKVCCLSEFALLVPNSVTPVLELL